MIRKGIKGITIMFVLVTWLFLHPDFKLFNKLLAHKRNVSPGNSEAMVMHSKEKTVRIEKEES